MRNLKNIQYEQWPLPARFHGRPVTAATWDLANDSVLCTIGPTEDNALIELVRINVKSRSQPETITSWDAPCPNPNLACDLVLSLHYFGDSLTACLVLAGGDIVVVREEPMTGEDRIEIVGSVDAGITASEWSLDEELLAITTMERTVIFMSRSFEGITDVTMSSEDLKASNHVAVGWGKKETQFQGKGAKALRDPTMPEKMDEGVLSPSDDLSTSISWRGDGAYLAISTIENASRRIIRVYSREGILDSVSEPVDGLEGALSWRPVGNLITGIQRFDSHIDVVFFERNGLRHGQFSLRLTSDQINHSQQHIKLAWNSDSSVLAVILSDRIQLWTMGNYHWYLKQEIRTMGTRLPTCSALSWHPESPLQFITSGSDGVNISEFVFATARGSTTPPYDHGVVAVIDGQTIKITPFRAANIPPPMALHDITVVSNAIDVSVNEDASSIAVLHQLGISIFEWKGHSASGSGPIPTGQYAFHASEIGNGRYQQITFTDDGCVLALQYQYIGGSSITQYRFNDATGRVDKNTSICSPSTIISTLSSCNANGLVRPFVQYQSGSLQSLALGENPELSCKVPLALPWIEIVSYKESQIAFAMSANGHLYADSRLLVKNCTSFITTNAHLIFTTTTHLIKFVHVTDVNSLEIPEDDPEGDERCRSIERGGRLVTAIPTSASIILQMPRGNLETIYPRAMVVTEIRSLIEHKNYKKAFANCRTQRVDLNILYDHAPEQFMCNVPLFIDHVKKISYIDLFLSSLREEDVTQTIYKETKIVPASEQCLITGNGTPSTDGVSQMINRAVSSKVNRICNAVLAVLESRRATNLQNIITANVCKTPPALEDGLLVIAQLMKEEGPMADRAVEHICFLSDVNKLYDNALGLYDLDLAILVAQQSQKDPREYLPFMQGLQEMTELRRRFSIDDYLHRYSKALTHLHALDAFTELQTYTQRHILYQSALSLYRYNPSRYSAIARLYAQHLESKSQFKEAALAYESLHDYTRAASCYLSSGPSQWREILFCALSQTPPLSGQPLISLATSLYEALIESKDYFAAATLQLDYLSSIENAVRTFCKGYFFADAFHLVALKQRPDLLDSVIDPGLADALSSSTELLAEFNGQLLAQVPRIRELRVKALTDPLAFYEGERGGGDDLPDDVSVAASSRLSTNRSLFTRYTGKGSQGQTIGTAGTGVSRATSKNRKREERKRARGKKGSVYEEEYLVASVGRLIERVESVRGEIQRLVLGLTRRRMWERARAVEGSLAEVIVMCQACIPEVFSAGEKPKVEVQGGEEYRPIGGDAVLQESIDTARTRKTPPSVAAFERLSLLGA